ncbi:GGDEF domain-containing protein [Glaciecola sp. XM2]|uniref:GGDEF domain-containing protein n=1 Tax=Glaciecola sp. XM2 TaxID=1914931 RepID=UPI001BDF61EA|nr:GGDEF domain-containing protein [Glaciecola sp. XM2]MBT1451341.1 GGDEF domain-containing protein [Glaciecola sp. XM2]
MTQEHQPTSVAQRTQKDIVDLIFAPAGSVLMAHVCTISIYGFWLYGEIAYQALLPWLVFSGVISMARFSLSGAYRIYAENRFSQRIWLNAWTALTVLLSLSYAYAAIVLTPLDKPEFVFAMGLLIFGLCGATTVSYAASVYAIVCMVVPVSALTSAYLLFEAPDERAMVVGVAIITFMVILLSLIRGVNRAFVKSIELNYQNQQEIDKRKLVERQLYDISRRDSLTSLFNRRYFDEVLDTELGRAYRNHTALSLVMLDVDYFKEYNDHYGHVAGDNCLIEVAQLIQQQANRKGDLVARYGGEEFAVILPGIDANGALAFAKRLQKYVESKRLKHSTTKLTTLDCVTISAGVTTVVPLMKHSPEQLILQADSALYQAKKEGRNRVKAYASLGFDQDLV